MIAYVLTRRQFKNMVGCSDSDIAVWLGLLTEVAARVNREPPVRFIGAPGDNQRMEIDEDFAREMGWTA